MVFSESCPRMLIEVLIVKMCREKVFEWERFIIKREMVK